jgi:hypothetical protein
MNRCNCITIRGTCILYERHNFCSVHVSMRMLKQEITTGDISNGNALSSLVK